MTKKARDKESVLDILVGTGGHHWRVSWRWRTYHIWG